MKPELKHTFEEALASRNVDTTDVRHVEAARQLYNALYHKRFSFDNEPILTVRKFAGSDLPTNPTEHLLRPNSATGEMLEIADGLRALKELGFQKDIDMLLIPSAIEQARKFGCLPMSVNVAYDSLEHADFRNGMVTYLADLRTNINPATIVFEVATPTMAHDAVIGWMQDVRRMGYKLALDNFQVDANGRTMKEVRPDMVKLSGSSVQRALQGRNDLSETMRAVRTLSPGTGVVAHWVRNATEAKQLHDQYGVDAVQGRSLPKDPMLFDSEVSLLYRNERNTFLTGKDWVE